MREPERDLSRLDDILSAILWVVIKEDLPLLKEQVTKYISELTEGS